ncbi:hypothetical protein L249_8548 [Ophiocordyceps polyrhachis-furcata BCC 54312]|uniref:Peptidase M14 domain-containing protein n=1 Tax=Ophiocordyceps polyrhachis-furcata BCC 54312 TaxID=1330021 RepID=A0A367L6K8_9HYPO|nr:hypothetical protein L249_8548 [Ophiocordyceps polyrhachis-furcata BCC 54312]
MRLSSSTLATLGLAVVNGCLLPEELDGGKVAAIHRRHVEDFPIMPIGEGDRFKDGELPIGVGQSSRADFTHILNVAEVGSALTSLADAYHHRVGITTFSQRTVENRTIVVAQIGRKPRVFFTSGLHARERGGPDNIIYFIADLLWANASGRGLAYGDRHYSPRQVKAALGVGVIFIPLVNPDGVAFDQKTNSCWRKNRNPARQYNDPADPSVWSQSIGVDINRNFPTLFDIRRFFSPSSNVFATTSEKPEEDVYRGPAPESETETKSVMRVLRTVKSLSWYLDLHSTAGHLLYSWGHDDAQSTDARQSFTNRTYDGQRGVLADDYAEFMEADQLAAQQDLTTRMAKAMNDAGGASATNYSASESAKLPLPHLDPKKGYPAWGSTDEAMSLYYGRRCGVNRISGITVEFGTPSKAKCIFYPDTASYIANLRQMAVGLMEVLLMAAADRHGNPKVWSGPNCARRQQYAVRQAERIEGLDNN